MKLIRLWQRKGREETDFKKVKLEGEEESQWDVQMHRKTNGSVTRQT